MLRNASILAVGVLLVLLLVTQSGCLLVAAAAGTGATVAYVRGDLETTVEASPPEVVRATELAMKELDIAVITNGSTELDGKVVGRTARDVKLTVVAKGQSDKLTKVSVRAGVFGDDSMQDRLLEKIRENLPRTSATADAK